MIRLNGLLLVEVRVGNADKKSEVTDGGTS